MRFSCFCILLPLTLGAQGRTYTVTTVDSASLHAVPSSSPIDALRGKVPGARITATSNAPGSVPLLQLRGSIAVPMGDPLIVVDGIVSPLTLADVNTDDVDRIEIVHGAAGGAEYGANGANGVVFITTKRGADAPSVTAHVDVGVASLPRRLPVSLHHFYQVDASGQFVRTSTGALVPEPDLIEDNSYPVYIDMRSAVIRPRFTRSEYLATARTWRDTRIYASLGDEREPGVLALLKGYSRSTLRLNLDRTVASRIDLAAGLFGARASLGATAADPFSLLRVVAPDVPLDAAISSNPYFALQNNRVSTDRSRGGWNLKAAYRPFSWLTFAGATARDRALEDSRTEVSGVNQFGSVFLENATDRGSYSDVSLVARRAVRPDLHLSGRVAISDETRRMSGEQTFINTPPPGFPPGPTNSSSFGLRWRGKSTMVGGEARWRERLTLEALVRRDREGSLGATGEQLVHHRLSAAWSAGATTIHVADGTAAPRIPVDFLLFLPTVFCPINGPCGGSLSPLRHPFAREVEAGVEHRFLGRLDARYTFSRQRTADQLFLIPVPPPSPVPIAWRNVGTTIGVTHEASLGARVLGSHGVDWNMDVNLHRVRVKMAAMTAPPFFITGTAGVLSRVDAGKPLGTLYGNTAIRTDAQLQETLRTGQLTGTASDYVRNEDGYFVRAADFHTINERPFTAFECTTPAPSPCVSYTSLRPIGDANPDFDLGIVNAVTWRTLSLHATVTAVRGGNIYNLARTVGFFQQRDVVFDQSAKPPAERKPVFYYTYFLSTPHEFFVESGSYVKLSELALGWRLPMRRAARAVITGRNLFTSTRYGGYDPEAAAGGAGIFAFRVDGLSYPAYRTIGVRFEFSN